MIESGGEERRRKKVRWQAEKLSQELVEHLHIQTPSSSGASSSSRLEDLRARLRRRASRKVHTCLLAIAMESVKGVERALLESKCECVGEEALSVKLGEMTSLL